MARAHEMGGVEKIDTIDLAAVRAHARDRFALGHARQLNIAFRAAGGQDGRVGIESDHRAADVGLLEDDIGRLREVEIRCASAQQQHQQRAES